MIPIAQSNPAPSGRRSAHAQTTGTPRAASSIDKSHESIPVTAQGCIARCPARRFWQPAQDPTRGSVELRSTRRQSPCPTLAEDLRHRAGWSGTDVEARPRSAPAMYQLSSDDSSRSSCSKCLVKCGDKHPAVAGSTGDGQRLQAPTARTGTANLMGRYDLPHVQPICLACCRRHGALLARRGT
jgi:hypothetical protein